MVALSRHIAYANSAIRMEAEAYRAGLLIAIHLGWSVVELESDCATLIVALSNQKNNCSKISRVVNGCPAISVRHVYHEANSVGSFPK